MAQATKSTSSAHTPAPWNFIDQWQIEAKNGKTICALSAILPSVKKDMSIQECHANAHLIAAAPELLEDLKALCVLMAEVIEAADGKINDFPHLVKAIKTIDKAEGKA